MLALSDQFGITINELLCGEQVTVHEAITQIAEENVVGILKLCDGEKKKSRRFRAAATVAIVCVAAILLVLFGGAVTAEISGDGNSLSARYYTRVAQRVADDLKSGRYEQAAKHVGFVLCDREKAEAEWTEDMTVLFSTELQIESFEVFPLMEDDEFISGKAHLDILDLQTSQQYTLSVAVYQQDGIAFAGMQFVSAGNTNQELVRGEEIETLLQKTLCTYYPG